MGAATGSMADVLGPAGQLLDGHGAAGLGDAQLLARFADRRDRAAEAAFAAIVARHGPMVYRTCRALLRDGRDAEEAYQATFVVLARRAGSVGGKGPLAPWLHGVARRVALKARSKAARRAGREGGLDADPPAPAGPSGLGPEVLAALHEEVGRLPEKYRRPVVLCHLGGLTHAEAAAELGWPVGTVSVRLARARDQLRGRLARRGVGPDASLFGPAVAAGATPSLGTLVQLASAGSAPAAIGTAPAFFFGKGRASMIHALAKWLALPIALGVGGIAALRSIPQVPPGGGPGSEQRPKVAPDTSRAESLPAVQAEWRAQSTSNLQQIGGAMHGYHNANNNFPAAAIAGRDGKPLLSWRVAILPYLDQGDLYKEFRLDEPWDSEHNKALIPRMPRTYLNPSTRDPKPGETHYLAFVGPHATLDLKPTRIDQFTDGTSNTVMVADSTRGVIWTKPEDVPFDFKATPSLLGAGSPHPGGFNALLADGTVHFLKNVINPKTFWDLLSRDGGEVVSNEELGPPAAYLDPARPAPRAEPGERPGDEELRARLDRLEREVKELRELLAGPKAEIK